MKWFQHDCDTSLDPKIKLLKRKYHSAGIGIYFEINRLIAKHVEKNTFGDWGFIEKEYTDNIELLVDETGAESIEQLQEVINYCVDTLHLLYRIDGRIANYRVLSRADRYTRDTCKELKVELSKIIDDLKKLCEQSVQNMYRNSTESTPTNKQTNNTNTLNNGKQELASPKIKTYEEARNEIGQKLSFSGKVGISKDWQDKAFRYANNLKINIPAEFKGRWLQLFKEASDNQEKSRRIDNTYTSVVDSPNFLKLNNDQKILYFFKVFHNKL